MFPFVLLDLREGHLGVFVLSKHVVVLVLDQVEIDLVDGLHCVLSAKVIVRGEGAVSFSELFLFRGSNQSLFCLVVHILLLSLYFFHELSVLLALRVQVTGRVLDELVDRVKLHLYR